MNISRIYAVIMRHLYVWPRGVERFMWSVGWPLLELLIWGLTTAYLQSNSMVDISFTTLILGGIIIWGMTTRLQLETTINFLEELWNKNLLNMFTTPLTLTEYLVATIILGIIKMIFSASLLVTVAFFFYKFNILQFNWYLPLILINLMIFGWVFGFFVTGLLIRFGRNIEEFAWSLIYFLQPFVGVFYPLSSLPTWAQNIGHFIPLSYIFEEMRRYIFSGYMETDKLFYSLFLNIVYLILSLWFLNLMFEKAKESGRLTKLD